MNEGIDDKLVIREVLDGNREAFALLVDKYKSGLYRLLLGMGANAQDAQDLAQESFIKAYQKLPDHNSQSSFAAWLYAIAINRLRDLKRRKKVSLAALPLLREASPPLTPEEQYMRKEEELEWQGRLVRLPERYRIILLLRYANELTYEEICEITGLSMHQVKNRLHRSRQKLKKQWSQAKEDSSEQMELYQSR
ncbi:MULTISPECIES: RNA polymerase sigma factor [unclassified Paenibacillus]|uniref:RNA polymerase sigma factor n=1 Tax=unclassified Paenibacillus TaxID=185978 RepID=UPI0036D075B8